MQDDFMVGRMPLARFSKAAQLAIGYACSAAKADRVKRVDSHHLLIGLLVRPDDQASRSEALQIIERLNVKPQAVAAKIGLELPTSQCFEPIEFTGRIANCGDHAYRFSTLLKSGVVTTGPLLYAIACDEACRSARLLRELGIEADEIIDLLTLGRDDVPPQTIGQYIRRLPAQSKSDLTSSAKVRYDTLPEEIQERIELAAGPHTQIDHEGWVHMGTETERGKGRCLLNVPTKPTFIKAGIVDDARLLPEQ